MLGLSPWMIIGALVLMMTTGASIYYYTTQAKIERLTEEKAILEQNVATITQVNKQNVEAINNLKLSFDRVQKDYDSTVAELEKSRVDNQKLKEKLGEHDLAVLASVKTSLVNRIVNNATKKAFRCVELMSGAPLNDAERKAKNGQRFNSECPWLFDTLVSR